MEKNPAAAAPLGHPTPPLPEEASFLSMVRWQADNAGTEDGLWPEVATRLLNLHAAATTRAEQAEAARAEMKQRHNEEVLDILRDMRLPIMDSALFAHVPEEYQRGVNTERLAINTYCRQKAYEYSPEGIGPDPELPGQWDTLPAKPTDSAAPPVAGEARKEDSAS